MVAQQDDAPQEKTAEKPKYEFTIQKSIACTPIKSQDKTGTCWSFATASFIESELIPDFGEQVVCSFNLKPGAPEFCFFGEVTRINMLRRKTDKGMQLWGPGKGDYFLHGQAYRDYHVKKSTARSWFLLRPRLAKFYQDYHPGKDKRERFEAVLKEHLNKVFLALEKEKNQSPFAPAAQAKLKALTKTTEVEIGKILGADGLAKFRTWKTAPANPASPYFGEPYRRPGQQPPVIRPTPPPVVKPGPLEEF